MHSQDPPLEINKEIGDVAIVEPSGSQIHFFRPPDLPFFDDGGEVRGAVLDDVVELLGPHDTKETAGRQEARGTGIYTVDGESYITQHYRLDIVQDELYVGASAGTEQIVLMILQGGVAGLAAELARRFLNKIAATEGSPTYVWSKDQTYDRVRRLLYNQFGAAGDITFTSENQREGVRELVATDSRGKSFCVRWTETAAVLQVEVQPPG